MEKNRMTQAQQIAFSRGRISKLKGEKRKDCPYEENSYWRQFWMDGFYSVEAPAQREEA